MSSRKRKPRKGITEAISITLPKSLISRVNSAAPDRERSKFIRRAIEWYLHNHEEVGHIHV
jgi:metal-responsive CopG/Arc/MetJ family transcriptional regulator